MRRFLLALMLLIVAASAQAQAPHADWRTLHTAHFRVHYPVGLEAWSARAASRLESIREAVSAQAGYAPDQVVDVIISNPVAEPNGFAWPLLDTPRIVFYTDPPGPDAVIGSYTNWIDLLAVHEVAHIVHMLRPSRNPLRRLLERRLVPLNRISLASPRWVLEGYATVLEGRLTGGGRPSGTMRAVILRQWAAHGRLPSYAQLESDQRFLGMSMAYLAGSAYLEWLEQRSGPESLRHLWSRITARQGRSFDEAFIGVFGETPERLYGQFAAELTASAIATNRVTDLREGALWQETPRASGEPALSPDGSQLAVVVRPRHKPARIVVWPVVRPDEEVRRYEERISRMLERDPQDVAPIRVKPLPRKPLHSFSPPDGGDLRSPRWTSDGKSLLYSHRQPDRDGFLHYDLFFWTPSTGSHARITLLADVRDADPLPDGRTAVAIRSRDGLSHLVSVDLTAGRVTALTEPSLDQVYSHPRVNRDGSRIAYIVHREGRWQVVIDDFRGGRLAGSESACSPLAGNVSGPEWSPVDQETLFATVAAGGFAEIQRLRRCSWQPITRSAGGAFHPAPGPDGRLFFMSLQPDGFVVRQIDATGTAPAPPLFDPTLVPAVPPPAPPRTGFVEQELPPARPYGLGRQEISLIFGQNIASSQEATEIGLRVGDVVGRLDTIALASFGDEDAQRGAAVASAWRGWPVAISGHLFHAEDRRDTRQGLELRASRTAHFPRAAATLEGGMLAADPLSLAFLDSRLELRQILGDWRLRQELEGSFEFGESAHQRGILTASLRRGGLRLEGRYQRDRAGDGGESFEQIALGGLPSSIIPRSAFARRVFDPALPVATLSGDEYQGRRVEVATPLLPLTMFWQEHRTDDEQISLAGLVIELSSEPYPLLRLPGFDLTLGAARILDEPLRGRTRWWFGMRWRP